MDSYPFLLRRDKVIVVIKIGLWATAHPPFLAATRCLASRYVLLSGQALAKNVQRDIFLTLGPKHTHGLGPRPV